MRNKITIIPILLIFSELNVFCQQPKFEYTYDAAGNRIKRELITINNRAKDAKVGTLVETENNYEITLFPNLVNEILSVYINRYNSDTQKDNTQPNFYEIFDLI
jgi:hypothetical protein